MQRPKQARPLVRSSTRRHASPRGAPVRACPSCRKWPRRSCRRWWVSSRRRARDRPRRGESAEGDLRALRGEAPAAGSPPVHLHADGYILTNAHVIEGAGRWRSSLGDDGSGSSARVVAALWRATSRCSRSSGRPSPRSAAATRPPRSSRSGRWHRNPFGLDHTVTVGIIEPRPAARRRPGGSRRLLRLHPDRRVDQPGQLGRAVINVRGEVIGINTAMNARAGHRLRGSHQHGEGDPRRSSGNTAGWCGAGWRVRARASPRARRRIPGSLGGGDGRRERRPGRRQRAEGGRLSGLRRSPVPSAARLRWYVATRGWATTSPSASAAGRRAFGGCRLTEAPGRGISGRSAGHRRGREAARTEDE